MKKVLYITPEIDIIEIKTEGVIASSKWTEDDGLFDDFQGNPGFGSTTSSKGFSSKWERSFER